MNWEKLKNKKVIAAIVGLLIALGVATTDQGTAFLTFFTAVTEESVSE